MEDSKYAEIAAFVDRFANPNYPNGKKVSLFRKKKGEHLNLSGKQAAEIMMTENVRSVNYRYNEHSRTHKIKNWKFPVPSYKRMYWLLSEWDYQSCERDDYKKSDAFDILCQLRDLGFRLSATPEGSPSSGWERSLEDVRPAA